MRNRLLRLTLLLILGDVGECHVSAIHVWQWTKQEFMNTPPSSFCWNSLSASSNDLRKPNHDYVIYNRNTWNKYMLPSSHVIVSEISTDEYSYHHLLVFAIGWDCNWIYSTCIWSSFSEGLIHQVSIYFVSERDGNSF